MTQSCKTCRHWNIDEARDKAGRVRRDRVARCQWPTPPLPASVREKRIHTSYMSHEQGTECPCWEKRT